MKPLPSINPVFSGVSRPGKRPVVTKDVETNAALFAPAAAVASTVVACTPPSVSSISLKPLSYTPASIPTGESVMIQANFAGDTINGSFGDYLISFTWFVDGNLISEGVPYFGATSPSLFIFHGDASRDGVYECLATGKCGTATQSITLAFV